MHDHSYPHLAANTADSAGQPWAGRQFSPNTFGQDDGSTPAAVASALQAFRADRSQYLPLIHALAPQRVLVPLVAVAGDEGVNDQGLRVDKTQELSIVTVHGPDGRTVLPVFTGVAEMQQWNPKARPVPVEMIRVALASAEENTELVVVNAASDSEFVIRRPALWAIAKSEVEQWLPSWADEELLNAFAEIAETEPSIAGLQLVNGDPDARLVGPELVVVLALLPGLGRDEVTALTGRLSQAWAAHELISERVDSLAVKLVAAR